MNTRLLKRGNFWRIFLALFIALALELCAGAPPWTVFADEDHIIQGNVGIGTTSPGGKRLKVQGDADVTGTLTAGGFSITNLGAVTVTGTMTFSGVTTDITTAGSEHLALMPGGNVGIGTTGPAAKLHVYGVAASGGGTVQTLLVDGASGNGAITINSSSAHAYQTFAQGGVAKFELGIVPTTSDFYLNPNTQVGSNGAAVYILKSNGNVGIGTTVPGQKLHVSGGSVYADNYYLDGTQIEGVSGRNYFKDSELSTGNGLRVGAAWSTYGIYAESGDVVVGSNTGIIRLGQPGVGGSVYAGTYYEGGTALSSKYMLYNGINADTYVNLRVIRNNWNNDGMYIGYGRPEAVRFFNNTTEVGRFNQGNQIFDVYGGAYISGNVGIGTTNPGEKLVVYGTEVNPIIGPKVSHSPLYTGYDGQQINALEIYGNNDEYVGLNLVNNKTSGSSTIGLISFANANTGAAEIRLGTIGIFKDGAENSGYFAFSTNNAGTIGERVRIDKSGNVGIGTTSLGQKLSVAGVVESTIGGFKFPDGTIQGSAGAAGGWVDDGTVVRLGTSSDNVGIGTTSPGAKLQVNSDILLYYSAPETMKLGMVGFGAKTWGVQVTDTGDGSNAFCVNAQSMGPLVLNGGLHVGGESDPGDNNLLVDGTSILTGNVGIGTTVPSYTLDVAGVIRGQATAGSGDVLRIGNDTKLVDIDVANTAGLYGLQDSTVAGLRFGSSANTLITSVANTASYFNNGGNVGIGTIAPNSTLTVIGGDNAIRGAYGRMLQSRDEWLRINDDDQGQDYHTNGIYMDGPGVGIQAGLSVGGSNLPAAGDINVNGFDIDLMQGSSGYVHRVGRISFDWTAGSYNSSEYNGIESMDYNRNWADSMALNSFNDITLRLDSNNNNGNSYLRVTNDAYAGGTVVFQVDQSGNAYNLGSVGIGTTVPQQKLQLTNASYIGLMANGGAYIPASWKRGSAGGIILASSANPDGSGWSYGSRIVNHDYGDGLGLSFDTLYNTAWTNDVLFISGRSGSNGKVGIGTTSPGQKLSVAGVIESTSGGIKFPDGSIMTSSAQAGGWTDGGANVYLTTATDYVGIGTVSPQRALHITQGQDGGSNSIFQSAADDRPGIALRGYYPEIDIISNMYTNASHGATLRLAAYDDSNRNTWKHWVIGTPGVNANHMDIGYAQNDANPHAGIADYAGASGTGKTIMRLQSNGNVGIGTTSPGYTLHINGNAYANNYYLDGTQIEGISGRNYFKDSELSTGTGLRVGAAWGYYGIYSESGDVVVGSATGIIRLQAAGTGDVRAGLFRDGDSGYYLDPANAGYSLLVAGSVGIGTTSPIGKVHIYAGGAGGVGWSTGLNIGDSSSYTGFIQDAGISRWRNFGTGGYDWWSSGGSQLMSLSNAGVMYMSGNVGIGTTSPNGSGKLHISGGDNSFAYFGPNGSWGAYLWVGSGPGRPTTSTASVASTNGNLHLDSGSGNDMYLNYYSAGRPIHNYGPMDSGYTISGTGITGTSYVRSNGNIYTDANYGYGLVGTYSSYRYQGIFAMSDSYKLAADGTTTGNLYGLAWSHPNAGGVASNLNTHGLLVMENGTFLAAVSGSIRARDDMRAPIFYDSNDTGYYVDPNGTSNMSRITNRTRAAFGNNGLYNTPRWDYTGDTRYWTGAMGWGTTDFNTIYSNWGCGFFDTWSSPGNAPGGSSHYEGMQGFHMNYGDGTNAYGWQMAMAGEANNRFFWRSGWPSPRAWVEMMHSGNIGSFTIPWNTWVNNHYMGTDGAEYATIFYDTNNSGYYVDPASTSVTNDFRANIFYINGATGNYLTSNAGYLGIKTASNEMTIGADSSTLYINYRAANGTTVNAYKWNAGTGSSWAQHEIGRLYAYSDIRSPIFYDQDNTGYYVDPASTSVLNVAQVNGYISRGGHSVGYLAGSYNNIGSNDAKTNPIYTIGTSYAPTDTSLSNMYGIGYTHSNFWGSDSNKPGGWGQYVAADGNIRIILEASSGRIWSSSDVRSPIFYDSNDTGYYVDPNGTSNLYAFSNYTRAGALNQNRIPFNRRNYTSDQNYWTNTIGWGNTYTWANAWEGGAGFYDNWGTSMDHPQGSGYIHAQGIISGLHYNATGTGYGWMMVGAANATENRYWLRGKWGGSTSGWVEMITTGNVSSYSIPWNTWINNHYFGTDGAEYATIYYDTNDSGYYSDPNGTSRLNQLNLNEIYMVGGGWLRSYGRTGMYSQSFGTHLYWDSAVYLDLSNNNGMRFRTSSAYDSGLAGYVYHDGSGFGLLSAEGNWRIRTQPGYQELYGTTYLSDTRSSIYYDRDDTGYYIDPNSTSNSALRMRGGALFGPNPSWGAYLYVGTNGNMSGTATVAATNGNLHIDSASSGYGTYLNWYSSGPIYHGSGTRIGINGSSITSGPAYGFGNGAAYNNLNSLAVDTLETDGGTGGGGTLELNYYGGNEVHIGPSGTKPLRAAIMYDGNNGGYYVDPNGNTNINALQTNNTLAGWPGYNGITQAYGHYIWPGRNDGSGAWWQQSWYLASSSSWGLYTNTSMYFAGGMYAPARVQATIFYDWDNTGYYVDPASTSNVNAMLSYSYQGNGNVGGTGNASWHPSGIYSAGTNWLYGTTYAFNGTWYDVNNTAYYIDPQYTSIFNDLRATIFYDYNNTGYYMDPNGTSRMSTINADQLRTYGEVYMAGWLRPDGYSGIYSPINGAHFYPNDSTYGAWKILGTRNTYGGINYNGRTVLMMQDDLIGLYNEAYGRWIVYGYGSNNTTYVPGNLVVSGYLYKNGGGFRIDHPLDPANKVLVHSFVESPDMKNLYDGVVVLDKNGESIVRLPDWFGALNKDFRYQLTTIGKPGMPYVKEEIRDNKFTIAGDPGAKVSWQVTGTRHDAYAEKNRIKVEEEKGSRSDLPKKGEYLAEDCYKQVGN